MGEAGSLWFLSLRRRDNPLRLGGFWGQGNGEGKGKGEKLNSKL